MPFPTGYIGSFEDWKTLTDEERHSYRSNIIKGIIDDKKYNAVIDRIRDTLDKRLSTAVIKCLQRKPEDRFINGVELYEFLKTD
jgi:hypothetical protein